MEHINNLKITSMFLLMKSWVGLGRFFLCEPLDLIFVVAQGSSDASIIKGHYSNSNELFLKTLRLYCCLC